MNEHELRQAVAAGMLEAPPDDIQGGEMTELLQNEHRIDRALWRLAGALLAAAPNPDKDTTRRAVELWEDLNASRYSEIKFQRSDLLAMLRDKLQRRQKRITEGGGFDWVAITQRAEAAPTPPELEQYRDEPDVLKLAKAMRQAQSEQGDAPVFITQAQAAQIMGRYLPDKLGELEPDGKAARRCLRLRLVQDGIIEVVDPGTARQAGTRPQAAKYRYIGGATAAVASDISSF